VERDRNVVMALSNYPSVVAHGCIMVEGPGTLKWKFKSVKKVIQ